MPAHRRSSRLGRTWLPRCTGLLLLPMLNGLGCTQATDPSGPAAAAGGDSAQPDDDLQVRVDRGDVSPAEVWTLSCRGVVSGTIPMRRLRART